MMTFSLNISCLCLYGTFTSFMLLNRSIRISTDCSADLIFIPLAAQLHYFELKNIYMDFLWILTNGFSSQNMIKISYSGKIAPDAGAILPPYISFSKYYQ